MSENRQSWKDVRDHIHDAILSGRYKPGDRLPRDADIAEELKCARPTVQRAMQDLADAGLIERKRKGGTRVRSDPVTRATLDIPITRREIEQKGGQYGYQLIYMERSHPPPEVQAVFEQSISERMLHVSALHLRDTRPYMLENRWISLETAPEILDVDLSEISANEWLVLNKPYNRLDVRFFAENANKVVADWLQTTPDDAVLIMTRTTWIDDSPITWVKSYMAPGYQMISRS